MDLIEEKEENESEKEIIKVNFKEKNKTFNIKNNKKVVKLHISSKLKIY